MTLAAVSLNDKYEHDEGTIYVTGSQAFVKLAMMQVARDTAEGLNTACFISGYRGSPMHNVDKELWRAKAYLPDSRIHFLPAVNEDIAATSLWGTQQVNLFSDGLYDGVFGLWYGKGPGLDRSIDAIRHANLAGTSKHGGVLAVVGDDHGMTSSDVTAVSEPTFMDLMMPVLYPATVQELFEYGLYGWALSRFCGAWVGFKACPDTLDTVATVSIDKASPRIVIPDFGFPPDGVHIRVPDQWKLQEPRLRRYKMDAALAFSRANRLNRVVVESRKPRFGIVTSGIAGLAVLEALDSLGIDKKAAGDLGITVLKMGMPHPFDNDTVRNFATGLEEVLVVEEKRRILEMGVKDACYGLSEKQRPRVVGRHDESGDRLISELGELSTDEVARVIAARISAFHKTDKIATQLRLIGLKEEEQKAREDLPIARAPFFCSGCPHNTSTRVPEGSRAHGGVGCHFMATHMERSNITHPQMGGEGATWLGQSRFVETRHVFQNIGDGTYFHSGYLAIRACVAAGVNITYKILFNDAVAMTGGQPVDGDIDPASITRQVHAEGVRKIAIVTDDPDKYRDFHGLAPETTVEHRRALDRVQREFREWKGVSVIVYDQTCAAEKRRRRKRGRMIDPPLRVFINERVCEGCGDCSEKSNCLSVLPVETHFGRKRRIDQSACNKDFSCREGFCPSFVSVLGGKPKKTALATTVPRHLSLLPEPERPGLSDATPYNILVTGIGGTGVVTVGAMITMAAHLEGHACQAIDQFGMAQKGGAVTSHIRVAKSAEAIKVVHLTAGSSDLVLGCDALVAAGELALETVSSERTHLVINTHEAITGHFTRDPDLQFPTSSLRQRLSLAAGEDKLEFLDGTRIATRLMGDSIATNLFMLGFAYQRGFIPVTSEGIEKAIELNGVAVQMNTETFRWGCRAAVDLEAVDAVVAPASSQANAPIETFGELVAHRISELTDYQNAAYAARYSRLVEKASAAEQKRTPVQHGFADTVARYAYKLMAYKDEYEVARLYSRPEFKTALEEAFDGPYRLQFHMAPPLLTPKDPETGLATKRTFGGWMLPVLKVLAGLRRFRGGLLDPFRGLAERRQERQLIVDYENLVDELCRGLDEHNHALAVDVVSLPEQIRGYGHVKQRHLETAKQMESELMDAWRNVKPEREAV